MEEKQDFELLTYRSGPQLLVPSSLITKDDIARIIDNLHLLFGVGYEFKLEPITEGGILWTKYPEQKPDLLDYKCFRFQIYGHGKWPRITEKEGELDHEWRNNKDPIWTNIKKPFPTCLKAFYSGSSPWTNHELRLFEQAFKEGAGIIFKKMPNLNKRGRRKK